MRPGQCNQPEGVLRSTQEGLRSTRRDDAVNPRGGGQPEGMLVNPGQHEAGR